jgi:hypothetical protein
LSKPFFAALMTRVADETEADDVILHVVPHTSSSGVTALSGRITA